MLRTTTDNHGHRCTVTRPFTRNHGASVWVQILSPRLAELLLMRACATAGVRPHKYDILQLARNSGSGTSIAQVTLTTDAGPCAFAASAVV